MEGKEEKTKGNIAEERGGRVSRYRKERTKDR